MKNRFEMSGGAARTLLWMGCFFLMGCCCNMLGCSEDKKPPPPATGCQINADCPPGTVCEATSGACVQCILDTDCDQGFSCMSLQCVEDEVPDDVGSDAEPTMMPDVMPDAEPGPNPDPNPDVPEPDPNPDAGPEPLGCETECPGLQLCDPDTETCVEPSICLADIDCFEGNVCFGSRCLDEGEVEAAGGCFNDAGCNAQGEDLFCNLAIHQCVPSGRCNNDNQCPGELACGPGGLCVQCAEDNDCPGGLVCNTTDDAFVCAEPDRCVGDDCRGDRRCQGGECREPQCTDDGFEPNSACGASTDLGDEGGTFMDQQICEEDCDWFSLDLAPGDGFVARVSHNPEEGDLDLTLHGGPCVGDDPGPLLQRSASLDPNEIISVPRTFVPTTYLFSVCPFITPQDGGTNSYDLEVMPIPGGFCVDDARDENSSNDEPTRASQLTIPERPFNFRDGNMQICPEAPDWFRVQLFEAEFVTVAIDLNDTFGDLDLKVFSGLPFSLDDAPLAVSEGRNNTESVSFSVPQTGEYYIAVFSPVGGQNAYELSVNVVDECTDSFEPNNSLNDAADLSGLPPTTFNGLRICAEDIDVDWYTSTIAQDEAVSISVVYDENLGQDLTAEIFTRQGDPAPREVSGSGGLLRFNIAPSDDDGQVFFNLSVDGDSDIVYSLSYEVTDAIDDCRDDDRTNTSPEFALEADLGVREYRGTICPDGGDAGEDFFTLTAPAGHTIYADIQNIGEGIEVEIRDANQTVVAEGVANDFGLAAAFENTTERPLFVVVKGANGEAQSDYLLQIYSRPTPEGAECTEDLLEQGSFTPEQDNGIWENFREIPTGNWLRNLILCPEDEDWYGFFVISGQNISLTIQTHEPVPGAIVARLYDPLGPPFIFDQTTHRSENGSLQININGIQVFDGGTWAVQLTTESGEPVWYDIRVITN